VDDTTETASVVTAGNLPDEDEMSIESAGKGIEKAKREIVVLLGADHGLHSKARIYIRIHGAKQTKLAALAELIEDGTVVETEGTFRLSSDVGQ
jgi:hypothetical protein